jgi:hypothetical protein
VKMLNSNWTEVGNIGTWTQGGHQEIFALILSKVECKKLQLTEQQNC